MEQTKKPATVSRREFLRGAGLVIGGTALAPLALSEACGGTNNGTSSVPTTTAVSSTSSNATTSSSSAVTSTNPTTGASLATTTSNPPANTNTVTTSASPATKTSQPPTSTGPTSTPTATNPATANIYFWIPPAAMPKLLDIPGCESKVADDRYYSMNQMWVKTINGNLVAIGISEQLDLTLDKPTHVDMPTPGTWLGQNDTIGSIEGYKMSADLICPVSGQIMALNTYLLAWTPGEVLEGIPGLTDDPYRTGWLFTMMLSKPDELKGLLSPAAFVSLIAKSIKG
jgi:glycine cleavage system H protein